MARISGVDLPREKQIQISLTYLYGIGNTSARKICAAAQVDPNKRTKDLTEDDIHFALGRGVNFLNWPGEPDPLSRAVE